MRYDTAMRTHGAALVALMFIAACGPRARSVATTHPTPAAVSPTEAPPAADSDAGDSAANHTAATAPAEETAARPMPDTPMCHAYRAVVDAAAKRFATGDDGSAPAPLPGAEKCDVTSGGKGHSFTATFTCQMAVADDEAALSARRDQLAAAIDDCGAHRAAGSTRVRLVRAAGKVFLVVNVHDTARW